MLIAPTAGCHEVRATDVRGATRGRADRSRTCGTKQRRNPPSWKHGIQIQHKLCNEHGLDVTVAHYPPGASKWNPIEHRLFSEISKNWAGRPLDSYVLRVAQE